MVDMEKDVEYQIIVGCNDSLLRNEFVKDDELSNIVTNFFFRERIDFSLMKISGGYLYSDGSFFLENGVCVTIIGSSDKKILKLANLLKMFMCQDNVLVLKNRLETTVI